MNKVLRTKYGNAKISNNGYYVITSCKEGNHGKYLHRLIYEDYYKVSLLPHVYIHHKDKNKLNNNPQNLEAMYSWKHQSLHSKGRTVSVKTKEELSEIMNKKAADISKKRTSTGFFRVSKNIHKNTNNGYVWRYAYPNGKPIVSVDLNELKVKVKEKGLEWFIVDESKANKSMEENNNSLPKHSRGGKHSYNYIPYAVIIKEGFRNGK